MTLLLDADARRKDPAEVVFDLLRAACSEREIARLADHVAADAVIRATDGVLRGPTAVADAVRARLSAFPDLELLGEEAVTCHPAQATFATSHRLLCSATHAGPGLFGTPTGRRLSYRVMLDCWGRDERVHDAWVVRDQQAILDQLGQDPQAWTRELIAREGGPERCMPPLRDEDHAGAARTGTGNDDECGHGLADLLARLMQGDHAACGRYYDRAAELFHPGNVIGAGPEDAGRFWLPLRAALPSATFRVLHRIGVEEPLGPPRAAVRWTLNGRHDGWGAFDAPSGADLHVMGITHAEFGPRGLRREWTLIDTVSVWKQILLARGAV